MRVRLTSVNDFAEWRAAARGLLLKGTSPDEVIWDDPAAPADLFAEPEDRPAGVSARAVGVVPPRFVELAEVAICHRETIRFGLLYRLLFRLQKDRELIGARSDPDISKLYRLVTEVRRDSQRMKDDVDFRGGRDRYAAWFEPEHYVVERTAPFFARRFAEVEWAILTQYRSVAWDGAELVFGSGTQREAMPRRGASDEAWRSYLAAVFGPVPIELARIEPEPARNFPEAMFIAADGTAGEQEAEMAVRAVAPEEAVKLTSLADARAAVQGCTRCPLYQYATQAVFGEGPQTAEVMFVGEQPGDQEDLAGKPFVGPAGQLFDRALEKVGIDRRRVYVTNAVKHFKFEPRGKKRIHQKPNAGEIQACRFWVDLEREFVRPKLVVALGATAVTSLMGKAASISSLRGRKLELPDGAALLVTVHPSYLLRLPDREQAVVEQKRFEADLRAVKAFIDRRGDEVRRGGPGENRAA